MISREELEELKNQLSEEKAQRVACELEIRDLKDKIKDVERSDEISSADALSVGKKNQELEEAMETLRLETVMAPSSARRDGWTAASSATERMERRRSIRKERNTDCANWRPGSAVPD